MSGEDERIGALLLALAWYADPENYLGMRCPRSGSGLGSDLRPVWIVSAGKEIDLPGHRAAKALNDWAIKSRTTK